MVACPDSWNAVFWDIGGVIVDLDSIKRAQLSFINTLLDEFDTVVDDRPAAQRWQQAVGDHVHNLVDSVIRPKTSVEPNRIQRFSMPH